jgi:hypothetical protein
MCGRRLVELTNAMATATKAFEKGKPRQYLDTGLVRRSDRIIRPIILGIHRLTSVYLDWRRLLALHAVLDVYIVAR